MKFKLDLTFGCFLNNTLFSLVFPDFQEILFSHSGGSVNGATLMNSYSTLCSTFIAQLVTHRVFHSV